MVKFACCIPGGSLMPEGVSSVPESPVTQIIEKCRYLLKLGYDFTECGGGMLANLTEAQTAELLAENEKSSLRILAVNSLFPGDWKLADPDADHKPYLARAVKIFDIVSKLGGRYAVFGSGVARSLPENVPLAKAMETLTSFMLDMADEAGKRGLTLLIEPLRKKETNVFVTVPESGEVVRELAHPHLRLLCDSFHMAEEKCGADCVRPYMELVDHCHISESPLRTIPGAPDSGDIGYNARFAAELNRAGYEGAVSVECHFDDFKSDAKAALAYMRRIFMGNAVFEVRAVRDMKAEPVYLTAKEGAVSDKVTALVGEGVTFPAGAYKDGVIALVTAKKGETFVLTAEEGKAASKAEIVGENGRYEVKLGGHHFADYICDGSSNKPYFGQVVDNAGNPFTRLDFTVKEHPHQRSVYIAVGDVNGVDCWNEKTNYGHVYNEEIVGTVSTAAYASITARNRWTDFSGEKDLVEETTKFTVYNQDEDCRLVDIETTFTAKYGEVVFGPTKEAGPLGIRLIDGLREDIGCGTLSNSWGGVGEKECWSRSAAWCDYAGKLEDVGDMGVTVFDNEKNERFPTAWHIRSYGLFAANNLFFKGGLTIRDGESLTYRFRLMFRRREMTREELSDRFVLYTLNPTI